MFSAATTTSRTSSTQQECIRKRMKNKGFGLHKLNGQMGNLLTIDPRNIKKEVLDDEISPKRRKFGSDSRNFVQFVDPDSEKELDDLPLVFNTPSTSTKRVSKAPTILNLRAFSNENSRFVKNVQKSNAQRSTGDETNRHSVKLEPGIHLSLPSSSMNNANKEMASCSSATTPFSKSDGAIERSEPWVKRKFYIVENAGRPTEIYCTDFIHKVKQGMLHHHGRYWQDEQQDGYRTLLRITDKWREEWSTNGVQVPLGNHKETYQSEYTEMFPEKPEPILFELPKKLLSLYPTKYTKLRSKEFQSMARNSLTYYLLDSTDEEWLASEEASGNFIHAKTFVDVMNLFELTAYKKIHDNLLEPIRTSRGASEEDMECMICSLPEWENGDNIVFCDGCNIAVHQSCYGVNSLPRGEWFCQLCTHFGPSTKHQQHCLFCPIKGGPMKPTKHAENWAHVACALWIPEVRFGDVETRQPITRVNEVPAGKWQARCVVCDTLKGACIECIHPKCSTTFHVGCAQRANFTMNIENDDHNNTGVRMVSLCDKHASPSREKKVRLNKNRLSDMVKNFDKFVNLTDLAEKSGTQLDVLQRIHPYWILKRSQKNCQPLIPEPEIADITAHDRNSKELSKRKITSKQKMLAAASALYDSIPEEELFQNYEKQRCLRLDSEKARNLCYMAKQRERLKLAHLECLEEQVRKTADVLFEEQPLMPISKRRLDKLLKEWKDAVESGSSSLD